METGIVFPHAEIGTDPIAIRDFAQAAEALGFTHMLIYDHVLGAERNRPGGFRGPYDKDVAFHEPFTTFSYLAALTNRISFMTAVLVLPQRQTALVAKQAAQLSNLSGGRFRLGIGTGWNKVEYDALGQDFHTRGKREEEQVKLLRELWRDTCITFEGKFDRVDLAGLNPLPRHDIPIWFGGSVDAVLRRTAKLGDGWVPIMPPNEEARRCLDTLQRYLADEGREINDLGIQAQAQIRGGNPDRWSKHAEGWRDLGCTHLAVATMGAGLKRVDDHINAAHQYKDAVEG
jgi:probable F420-dependent oxidoreductase